MHVGIPEMGRMQRSLRNAHKVDKRANERIATGKSINRAADNSAAFAVSTKLDAFTRSRNTLARSLNSTMAVSETAEAGLAEVNQLLKRARELAVQGRSETLSSDERALLQIDFEGTIEEIDRVAQSTKFNGTDLLRFRGVDVGFVVDRSSSMASPAANVRDSVSAFQTIFTDAKLDVRMGVAHYYTENGAGTNGDGTYLYQDLSADSVEPALQAIVDARFGGLVDPYGALVQASGLDDPNLDDTFTWRSEALKRVMILVTDTGAEAQYTSNPPYATVYSETATASLLGASDIEVHTISNATAPFDEITTATGGSQGALSALSNPTGASNPLTGTTGIAQQLVAELASQTGGGVKQIGIFDSEDHRASFPVPVDVTPVNLDVDEANVSTAADAGAALEKLDAAIDDVNGLRSDIGAFQVRLESVMRNNTATTETEMAAMAKMTDANIAEEMAKKMGAAVKAQAASALMLQARSLQRGTIEKLVG